MSTPASPQRRENPEPRESRHPVPVAIVALVSLMLGWAAGYLTAARPDADPALGDQRIATVATPSGAEASAGADAAAAPDGAALFASRCAACHQGNGAGLPGVFPPLAGSEWVTGDPGTLVQVLLHGVSGELSVAGQVYQGSMPAFGAQLSDAEIAAVTSHIRSQWGNQADAIPVDVVAAERARTAERSAPWAGGAELSAAAR